MKKLSKKIKAFQYLVDLTFDFNESPGNYEYTAPKNASARILIGSSKRYSSDYTYYFKDDTVSTWQQSFGMFKRVIEKAGKSGIQLTSTSVIIDEVNLPFDMGKDDKFNFTLMTERSELEWYEILKCIKIPDGFCSIFMNPIYTVHDMLNSYDKVKRQYAKKDGT